jgi:hypothetical protein
MGHADAAGARATTSPTPPPLPTAPAPSPPAHIARTCTANRSPPTAASTRSLIGVRPSTSAKNRRCGAGRSPPSVCAREGRGGRKGKSGGNCGLRVLNPNPSPKRPVPNLARVAPLRSEGARCGALNRCTACARPCLKRIQGPTLSPMQIHYLFKPLLVLKASAPVAGP